MFSIMPDTVRDSPDCTLQGTSRIVKFLHFIHRGSYDTRS
jgi:hypothetical protein